MKAIINADIILEDKILKNHVIVFDSKIREIIDQRDFEPLDYSVIDAKQSFVSPGFIDLHIHGSGGADTMDATKESIDRISKTIVKNGVTSYLPTTMTMKKELIEKALENIRDAKSRHIKGARVLGAHLEGPFISKLYKGAQDPRFIIKPDYEWIKPYLDIIKIITFAPEEDNNHDFIKKMKRHKDVVLSIGHTNASFEQAIKAIDNGVNYVTHAFNAMTGLHHRNPGVIGAIFSRNIKCELIADKVHVHQGFFQAFIDINKRENIILVTDSMMAGCMKNGEYRLGGQRVIVDGNSARLEDKTLAGSVLKLNEAVRNIYENTNYDLNHVVNMASINQARVLGLEDKIGSIEQGKIADLIVFDKDINIEKVIIEGEVY